MIAPSASASASCERPAPPDPLQVVFSFILRICVRPGNVDAMRFATVQRAQPHQTHRVRASCALMKSGSSDRIATMIKAIECVGVLAFDTYCAALVGGFSFFVRFATVFKVMMSANENGAGRER